MDSPSSSVSRRRLIQLAGTAGVAAALAGCGTRAVESPGTEQGAPAPADPPAAPATAAPAPPAAPAGTVATLLCRESWGAAPARPGGTRHTINRLTLHHSGIVLGDNRNVVKRFQQHQHYHQDQHGWIDIAYHVGVDRRGNLFELRSPSIAGDTATSYDTTGHFLVLCEGDFEQEAVTEEQLHGAALAFAWAAKQYRVESRTLEGHRDADPATECPGANLYAHLTAGDLKVRIDELLAAGGVNLQRVCGAEADAIIADIEAGR